jgi:hypothetical protein
MAVDPNGAAVDEPLDPPRGRRVQQPARAVEVHRLEELVALAALPHRDGKVEHVGHAAHGTGAQLLVGNASRQDFDPLARQQGRIGLLLGAVREAEHHHLGAAPSALLSEVRADESGPTGDQKLHRAPLIRTAPRGPR